jgi:hypothetical protein
VLSDGCVKIQCNVDLRGSPATSEASLLSELDRPELGQLWAVTLRAAYLRALDESRAMAARRMLDDPELRAIHAEFRRRELLDIEQRTAA